MHRQKLQKSIRLFDLDKARLVEHAEWFGMVLRHEDGDAYTLSFSDGTTVREIKLEAECAHLRLLAELCEKTLPWIVYVVGADCADVYLGHSDRRIRRLAELYGQRSMPKPPVVET